MTGRHCGQAGSTWSVGLEGICGTLKNSISLESPLLHDWTPLRPVMEHLVCGLGGDMRNSN
jgi:hypothetical protein